MNKPLIIKNLSKSYGKINALNGISFEVNTDEVFALIGPNGAGKSTTLKIISTLLSPTSGEVSIFGLDIKKDQEKIREIISYLPEETGAYKNLSGLEYLKFMASMYTDDHDKQNEYLERAKDICKLGKRLKDKIGTYSKGMTRKLLVARAIMSKPKLAILDETTSGLDVINALSIRNTIKTYAKNGMTVLLSSHNMLEIEYLSDRVALINKGKIYDIGTPNELKSKYKSNNLEEVFVKATQ